MLSIQERVNFNGLRTNYYVSGRMLFLHNELSTGAIMLGYAIESFFKQTLLELGNKNQKLQHSHDLKFLFESCKKKGAFNDVQVPNDFIDFSNSVFQMRYPSTQIKEALKAYDRNNVIGLELTYLFCYDDFFQQLDESLFSLTKDHYSSSILKIFAGINEKQRQYGLYFNSAVLKNYEVYRERTKVHFAPNKEAIKALNNEADFFWTDGYDYHIYADLKYYIANRELLKFKFPGEVIRDEKGKITHLKF